MKRAWVIRPYPHNIYRMKEFLSKNIVAIGWAMIGNLTDKHSRDDIKGAILTHYRAGSPQSLGAAIGNIYRFKEEVKIGDYVLVPDGQDVFIAQVDSGYKYDRKVDSNEEGYPHQRSVMWLHDKRAIPRNLLTGRVFDSLKGRQTVYATYYEDIEDTVTNKKYLFTKQSNTDLKREYLKRLQGGLLRNVNSNTFEDAVCALFSSYFPGIRRLATTGSPTGDTDLLAELPGNVNVRIQVKHFYPEHGEIEKWVVEQLTDSMSPGDHGIVVTSGTVGKAARETAEQLQDRMVNFIEGPELVDLLFGSIDSLPAETLNIFGLSRHVGFM